MLRSLRRRKPARLRHRCDLAEGDGHLTTFVFTKGWCTSWWITAVYILVGLAYGALAFEDKASTQIEVSKIEEPQTLDYSEN